MALFEVFPTLNVILNGIILLPEPWWQIFGSSLWHMKSFVDILVVFKPGLCRSDFMISSNLVDGVPLSLPECCPLIGLLLAAANPMNPGGPQIYRQLIWSQLCCVNASTYAVSSFDDLDINKVSSALVQHLCSS